VRRRSLHLWRTLARWTAISSGLSALLLFAAGTTQISSLRTYLVAFSIVLLVTMLAVDPQLARERANPGEEAIPSHLRFLAGGLFLLTLGSAAFFVGRTDFLAVPSLCRWFALTIFVASSSLQTWSMTANPFFSPVVRLQPERGHVLIDSGPYRFIRHPGYLAMFVSVPSSALAIGSWLALIPAAGFVTVILHRAGIEDRFLKSNLPGYAEYAQHVPSGLPLTRST